MSWWVNSLIVVWVLFTPNAAAHVGLHVGCYNSYDTMSADLDGEKLDFSGFAVLKPDSIKYTNEGASTGPNSAYSYSLTLNEYKIESGSNLAAESGSFEWHAQIISDHSGNNNSKIMKLSANNIVENGLLETFYGNSDLFVEESVTTENAVYEQQIGVDKSSIQSEGAGATPLDSSSTAEIRGFSIEMRTKSNSGTWGTVKANVYGDTNRAIWSNGVESKGSSYSFGVGISGITKTSMQELNMEGEATDIPKQRLPSGEVKIEVKSSSDIDPEDTLEYLDEILNEIHQEYPDYSSKALWYLIDQEAYINPTDSENNTGNYGEPGEYYRMKMAFSVDRS